MRRTPCGGRPAGCRAGSYIAKNVRTVLTPLSHRSHIVLTPWRMSGGESLAGNSLRRASRGNCLAGIGLRRIPCRERPAGCVSRSLIQLRTSCGSWLTENALCRTSRGVCLAGYHLVENVFCECSEETKARSRSSHRPIPNRCECSEKTKACSRSSHSPILERWECSAKPFSCSRSSPSHRKRNSLTVSFDGFHPSRSPSVESVRRVRPKPFA